ncbi:recombinase family protein, partial [Oleiphilus sp. HI0123]
IYTRYSSDKQNPTSLADQERICKKWMNENGLELTRNYQDGECRGSVPTQYRLAAGQLIQDAKSGCFDVIVIEALDRFTRNLADQEKTINKLELLGIRVIAVNEGYDTEDSGRYIKRVMHGAMSEQYLRDLGKKTHRGMSGQVARGFSVGAAPFGYRNIRTEHGSNTEINPEAAKWVIWIFKEFASGRSCQSIVYELNEMKIKSPRGSSWSASALYGSPKKGSGILNNERYRGRYIWNRAQWRLDYDTGKKVRIERPESEWSVNEREDLRIVSDELWAKVRLRFKESRYKCGIKGKGGRVRSLLGGLMTCGKCGGSVVAVGSHSYGCSSRMNRGSSICDGVNVSRKKAERNLLSDFKRGLLSDELINLVYDKTTKEIHKSLNNQGSDRASLSKRLEEINKKIDRYVEAIGKMGSSDSLLAQLESVETEKSQIKAELSQEQKDIELPKYKEVKRLYENKVNGLPHSMEKDISKVRRCLMGFLGEIEINKVGTEIYATSKSNRYESYRLN